MSGCRSCSGCSPEPKFRMARKAEKLGKAERSNNPRYPHVLVGKPAIFSENDAQLIVKIVSDNSNDNLDSFTLELIRVIKNLTQKYVVGMVFDVSKNVGDNSWKLHALL